MDNRYDYIDSAKEIEKNLQVEASLTRLLYKNHPIAAIAVIVNSLIIAVVMWREVAPRVVVIWAAVNITLQVIRFLMYISFTRSAPKDAEMPIWRKRFVVSMGVSGLVFGSSAIFIFPLGSLPHQVFLAFVMGGMASGALGFFSSSTMAFTLYIVPVIGIITVRFFMQDGLIPISMGIMATIFLVLLLVTARRMRGYLYANFSLNRDLQREVSEHKKTETKLKDAYETARENEKKFHDIFVNASDGIILAGVESKRFISANPMICKMIGYEEGELKGLGIMDIHPAEELPYIIGEFEKQAGGEIKIAANIPVKRKDGSVFYAEINTAKMTLNGKDVLIGFFRDVTERKEAEEKLREASAVAEEAARVKGDFLSTMSHEMRTPLTAIRGVCDMLKETSLTTKQEDNVRIIDNAGEVLLDLINDVLDFAKIEAGLFTLDEKPFNLYDAVKSVSDITSILSGNKGIEFSSDIDQRVPEVLVGDIHRLEQIILNLTANAVKFTEEGGVSLSVSIDGSTVSTHDEVTLLFVVKDSGTGIPDSVKEKIFDRFTQGDSSTARRFGGTGLGLSIVKNLVNHMGGDIRVDSEEGRGSTFSFTARFAVLKDEVPDKVLLEAAAEEEYIDKRPLKVLIAEDAEYVRIVISHLLKDLPYKIDTVENGVLALEKFKASGRGGYDIVLMDMEMPEMDGYTATKKIREYEGEKGLAPTPVIAITAYALEEHKQKCIDAGCSAYVSKPFTKFQLIKVIIEQTGGELVIKKAERSSVKASPGATAEASGELVVTLSKSFEDIVPGFIKSTLEKIVTLSEQLEREDYEEIRAFGHKLKGEGGSLGFSSIAEYSSAIEDAVKVKNAKKVRERLDALRSYLEEVRVVYE